MFIEEQSCPEPPKHSSGALGEKWPWACISRRSRGWVDRQKVTQKVREDKQFYFFKASFLAEIQWQMWAQNSCGQCVCVCDFAHSVALRKCQSCAAGTLARAGAAPRTASCPCHTGHGARGAYRGLSPRSFRFFLSRLGRSIFYVVRAEGTRALPPRRWWLTPP
ncbi:hypothetical protein HJG60_010229 [Phyllostomus discolor]|uniref:Uncharacterized protein n=1 Tax=Phyllostomus discolor TaxID=89673 RepID=A0A834AY54_9CHIR|nr:hypothetical protein HJG60_010229 [Phyllostomus discolor]